MIFAQEAIIVFEGHRCNCNIQISDNSKSSISYHSELSSDFRIINMDVKGLYVVALAM